jgi:hypothetical protein
MAIPSNIITLWRFLTMLQAAKLSTIAGRTQSFKKLSSQSILK